MEKHQPYGSLFMYSFLKHVYLRENRPCHACAQGPREQIDVKGKANANFVGKFSKAVAYAIRFLGGSAQNPGGRAVSAVAAGCYAWRAWPFHVLLVMGS